MSSEVKETWLCVCDCVYDRVCLQEKKQPEKIATGGAAVFE